jgi:hypothetical protein
MRKHNVDREDGGKAISGGLKWKSGEIIGDRRTVKGDEET